MEVKIFGDHEQATIDQMNAVCSDERVKHAVLCADAHLGYSVPVGGVVAYDGHINVNGVGYDIACGCKAVRLDKDADKIRDDIYRTMNDVEKYISFGVGRKNNEEVHHELFEDPVWDELPLLSRLKDKAREQLGTVGSGNHFVDIFVDDSDRPWVGVHFGSRGLGHAICTEFVKLGGGKDGVHAEPVIFKEDSDLGEQYLKCMEMAGKYAYAGRDWVCSRVAKILKADIMEEVHNHHNFAWKETHYGDSCWVIRKGATPNTVGLQSFVGGSMGDYSYILEGIESEESQASLYSTIHGAGRIMGRMQAKGKVDRKSGAILRAGLVSPQDMQDWIKRFDVELRGADVDEAPQVYKRIEAVLHAHRNTTKIVHRLKPIGVAMCPNKVFDPYKD